MADDDEVTYGMTYIVTENDVSDAAKDGHNKLKDFGGFLSESDVFNTMLFKAFTDKISTSIWKEHLSSEPDIPYNSEDYTHQDFVDHFYTLSDAERAEIKLGVLAGVHDDAFFSRDVYLKPGNWDIVKDNIQAMKDGIAPKPLLDEQNLAPQLDVPDELLPEGEGWERVAIDPDLYSKILANGNGMALFMEDTDELDVNYTVYLSLHPNNAQGFEALTDGQIEASVRVLDPASEEQATLMPNPELTERHDYRNEEGDYFVIISGVALKGADMTRENLSEQLQEIHQPLVSGNGVGHVCGINTGDVSLTEQNPEGDVCSGIAPQQTEPTTQRK